MGYDFHITRAAEWHRSKSSPIHLSEWKKYIASDPEFRLDGFAEATTTEGETIRCESDGLAVWIAYSGYGKNGNIAWFDHRFGEIVVKNADDEILEKMRVVAGAIGATVMGDEGEVY